MLIVLMTILVAAFVTAQEPILHEYSEASAVYMRPGSFPQLLPHSPFEKDMRNAISTLSPTVGVEIRFSLPIEEERYHSEEFPLELYNLLHQTTTLKGVEYYSASRDRMAILFKEAWTINNSKDRMRIPDQTFISSIPPLNHEYAYVDTGTFGEVSYNIRYAYQDGYYWVAFTNETPLRSGFFTVARPGNFQMYILISPAEEGLQIYASTIVFNIFLSKNNPFIPVEEIQTSLRNRIRALFVWLRDQINSHS